MTDKHSKKYTFSDDELDDLLGDIELVAVPDNFTNKVLHEIEVSQKSEWWQWLALIGGGIPALLQILAFIFSAWNVASLG